jgi:hypothetical protein
LAYLRISEARAAGQAARSYIAKSASQILMEDSRSFSSSDRYDIFLSHCYQDADVIYGIKNIIKKIGLTVYVDWMDDLRSADAAYFQSRVLMKRGNNCRGTVLLLKRIHKDLTIQAGPTKRLDSNHALLGSLRLFPRVDRRRNW